MAERIWKKGDRVVHAARPEWGVGEVAQAVADSLEGRSCQRLTVRFARAGLKTLSTAVADLREPEGLAAGLVPSGSRGAGAGTGGTAPAGVGVAPSGAPTDAGAAIAAMSPAEFQDAMTRLPEASTDPFRSLEQRLSATLGLYRYADDARGLIDWAVAQCGLADPLSLVPRHELERLFQRFRITLDAHLKRLGPEVRKRDPDGFARAVQKAPPAAVAALRRLDIAR